MQPGPVLSITSLIIKLTEQNDKYMSNLGKRHICEWGHVFYRRGGCTVCPVCAQQTSDAVFGRLARPAQRALRDAGIYSLAQLATYRREDILALHGMGKRGMQLLEELLQEQELSFLS